MSAKLQYPVLSWLQFSVEMPGVVLDPDRGKRRPVQAIS